MGIRKPRYFMLYYYDDDAKVFNVVGPITDDTLVGKRTVDLQHSGRNVRISTTSPETDAGKVISIEECIRRAPVGYKYSPSLKW